MAVSDVVERLCLIARDYRRDSNTFASLLKASGYLDNRSVVSRESVLEVLKAEPALIDDWYVYSGDQRVPAAWVFAEDDNGYVVYHYVWIGGEPTGDPFTWTGGHSEATRHMHFSNRAEACAEFVLRQIEDLAHYLDNSDLARERLIDEAKRGRSAFHGLIDSWRCQGFSKFDAIRKLRDLYGLSFDDAKATVNFDPSWNDVRESDENFQAELERAFFGENGGVT